MNRERKHYVESCEVSRLVRYKLGGVEQKVTLEGRRADAPVVIFLHGGPGSPLPISVGTRGHVPGPHGPLRAGSVGPAGMRREPLPARRRTRASSATWT